MLRSYEYAETPYKRDDFQSDFFREKEIKIARRFVEEHRTAIPVHQKCSICGNQQVSYFYTKWGVEYVRCKECDSIFALCESENVEQYRMNQDLIKLRTSKGYQQEIKLRRKEAWSEFIEWLEVRSYRFMKKNRELSIIDIGNRYIGYVEMLQNAEICGNYNLRNSILPEQDDFSIEKADLVLYLDQLQQEREPVNVLKKLRKCLKDEGLLLMGTRAGSGFDILSLKENNSRIYPYEHVTLPSIHGLIQCVEQAGFQILEVTTPGVMDVQYVLENKDKIEQEDTFVQYLMNHAEMPVLQEFQRFLQKSGLSSFVRIIARKDTRYEK